MADDRDRRRLRTAPLGVQLSPAPREGWDPDLTPTPTSVPEALDQVRRRQRDTQKVSENTLTHVSSLRTELKSEIAHVSSKVDRLHDHVSSLGAETANMGGKLEILIGDIRSDRDERSTINIAAAEARIEVDKTDRIAAIDERKANAAHRRVIGLKVLGAVGGLWALISAMLLAGRC